MQQFTLQFWFLTGSILFSLLASKPTQAQIIPDTTLPVNSSITSDSNTSIINGGTRAGSNLFHSFEQFSVPTGSAAHFNNPLDIQNIFSRVTGSSISNIDGLLQANGAANLFLLNPNGMIFGSNAQLNIGGSFIASTAYTVRFADGTDFSAKSPANTSVLTVSVPIGLQYGENAGSILNQSTAIGTGTFGSETVVGLQVQPGKTLALLGGDVVLEGGYLTAEAGRIELGSVAGASQVSLQPTEQGWTIGYEGVQNFQDIQLSQGVIVDASGAGGGDIYLQGRNITLTDASQVYSGTLGAGTGGIIAINAAESVLVNGGASITTFTEGTGSAGDMLVRANNSVELLGISPEGYITGLAIQVCVISPDCGGVTGNGGNLTIETRRLLIQDGARVDASTFGAGRGGDVLVRASDAVELNGASPFPASPDTIITSGIFTNVGFGAIPDAGDAGNLTIFTRSLSVLNGAQIASSTFAGGNGGTLTINASDFVQVSGASPLATRNDLTSGIYVSAEAGTTGNAGQLNITTPKLTVEDGAQITANNYGPKNGGTVTLNNRELIIQNGGIVSARAFDSGDGGDLIVNATDSIEIAGTRNIEAESFASALSSSAEAESTGKGGNITITTGSLNIRNGAEVTVSSLGTGDAGNILNISADDLYLDNGSIITTSISGNGGNIENIQVQNLRLRKESFVPQILLSPLLLHLERNLMAL
ncbi:MAG TPA: filamentous hemagglutinin N-terminal domain-containing protein [Candidatus Obscuribacterales bacterium]